MVIQDAAEESDYGGDGEYISTIFIVVTGNALLNTCFDKGCNLLFHHGDSVWLSLVAR